MKVGEVITKIQEKLRDPHDFVKVVKTDVITIVEKQNLNNVNTLQKVRITDIPFDLVKIWLLNELEKDIRGLVLKEHKTPEAILCIPDFTEQNLYIYFIEMKSEPDIQMLNHCYEKIQDALTRFFFLLVLNERQHQREIEYKNLKLIFRGVIFYLPIDTTTPNPTKQDKLRNLNNALSNPNCKLEINFKNAFLNRTKEYVNFPDNFLGLQKVETKFFPVPFGQTEFEITYEDLIKNF